MDRLPLLKALADDSRYAIFVEMSRARAPLSTNELAEALDLHPNTVRLHLERLREVGLVEVSTVSHGSVGRPQHHWAPAVHAPSLGLEPGGFRMLAHLLAEAAAVAGPEAEALTGIGHRAGLARLAPPGRVPTTDQAATPAPPPGTEPPERAAAAPCLQAVVDGLADLGFDPVLEAAGDGATPVVAFTSCPFRELAVVYPDLVCALHRGVTEGIVAAAARDAGVSAGVSGFSTLVDADPCRAELAIAAGA